MEAGRTLSKLGSWCLPATRRRAASSCGRSVVGDANLRRHTSRSKAMNRGSPRRNSSRGIVVCHLRLGRQPCQGTKIGGNFFVQSWKHLKGGWVRVSSLSSWSALSRASPATSELTAASQELFRSYNRATNASHSGYKAWSL